MRALRDGDRAPSLRWQEPVERDDRDSGERSGAGKPNCAGIAGCAGSLGQKLSGEKSAGADPDSARRETAVEVDCGGRWHKFERVCRAETSVALVGRGRDGIAGGGGNDGGVYEGSAKLGDARVNFASRGDVIC